MKKIAYLVIVLFNCTSHTTFASAKEEQSKTSENVAMKGLKRQDKADVYLYTPNKKNLHNQLADMPATKLPFTTSVKKSAVDFDSDKDSDSDADSYSYDDENFISPCKFDNALYRGDIKLLKEMIAAEKYWYNLKNNLNPNAHHQALFRSSLVNAQIDLENPHDYVCSPLEKAVKAHEQTKTMEFLIDEGADINYKGRVLGDPIKYICLDPSTYIRNPQLLHTNITAIDILIKANVDCNKNFKGQTPLHQLVRSIPETRVFGYVGSSHDSDKKDRRAALKTQVSLISKLLTAGANPYLRDGNGKTVFEVAKASARKEGCNSLENFLCTTISKQTNIAELKREARAQLISDEYHPVSQSNVYIRIKIKYTRSLHAQGREEELLAYRTEYTAREENMPELARLAHARELSRQSHALFENSKKN